MQAIEIQRLGKENYIKQQELFRTPLLDPSFLNKTPTITVPQPESPIDHGTYDKLNQIFEEQTEDQKIILEAREILGEDAAKCSDEQLINLISEMKYLLETWMEEFERSIFDGKTLNELIGIAKP